MEIKVTDKRNQPKVDFNSKDVKKNSYDTGEDIPYCIFLLIILVFLILPFCLLMCLNSPNN